MPKISIIVPIYNVNKYLHKCIDSILNQTFTDYELILVNDGSTDNCKDIIDSYAKQDNRIITIHQKNGGLSNARNAGLKIAQGEYIRFVDGDDHLPADSIEILLNEIEKNKDIVLVTGNYIREESAENKILIQNFCEQKYFTLKEFQYIFRKNLFKLGYMCAAWNKLYRNNIIKENDLLYEDGVNYSEDGIFTLKYIMAGMKNKNNKLVFLQTPVYYYVNNPNSLTTKKRYEDKSGVEKAYNIFKEQLQKFFSI